MCSVTTLVLVWDYCCFYTNIFLIDFERIRYLNHVFFLIYSPHQHMVNEFLFSLKSQSIQGFTLLTSY